MLLLAGILGAVAVSRFSDDLLFDERGFHDAVKTTVQHARRVAVASRRYVCVTTSAGVGPLATVAVSIDTTLPEANTALVACATAVPLPAPGRGCAATNQVCAPNRVSLAGSNAIFDPIGRSVTAAKAVAAASLTITVSNQPPITIAQESGWVL